MTCLRQTLGLKALQSQTQGEMIPRGTGAVASTVPGVREWTSNLAQHKTAAPTWTPPRRGQSRVWAQGLDTSTDMPPCDRLSQT